MPRVNTETPQTNAADPRQVAEAKTKEQILQERAKRGLRKIVADSESRYWLWTLLKRGNIFMTSWHGDTADMAFREGQRNMALGVMSEWMEEDPDSYVLAMTEQKTG